MEVFRGFAGERLTPKVGCGNSVPVSYITIDRLNTSGEGMLSSLEITEL